MDMAEALHLPWAKFIIPASQPVALDLLQGKETSAWFDLSPGAYNVHSNSMNAVPEVISRIYSKIQPDFEKIETSAALVRELVRKVLLLYHAVAGVSVWGVRRGGGAAVSGTVS